MREGKERGVGGARVKMIGSRRKLHPPGSKGERDEGSERGEGGKEEREEKRRGRNRRENRGRGGGKGLARVSREARETLQTLTDPKPLLAALDSLKVALSIETILPAQKTLSRQPQQRHW